MQPLFIGRTDAFDGVFRAQNTIFRNPSRICRAICPSTRTRFYRNPRYSETTFRFPFGPYAGRTKATYIIPSACYRPVVHCVWPEHGKKNAVYRHGPPVGTVSMFFGLADHCHRDPISLTCFSPPSVTVVVSYLKTKMPLRGTGSQTVPVHR